MTRTDVRLARLAGALVAGTLVLTGCAGGSDTSSAGSTPSSAQSSSTQTPEGESATVNDADVSFVQGMIPHHRGALAMAELAGGRAEDPRVLDLAGRIEAAQQPEIDTMTGWLEEWGEPVPEESDGGASTGHGSTGGHGSSDMGAGMDTGALEGASGPEFDRMFLEMMTEHHRGAVEMAETEIAEGSNPDAIALAQEIADSQTAEIQEMETLLAEIG
jgi:uncharacterized protein (DUF305 family)